MSVRDDKHKHRVSLDLIIPLTGPNDLLNSAVIAVTLTLSVFALDENGMRLARDFTVGYAVCTTVLVRESF